MSCRLCPYCSLSVLVKEYSEERKMMIFFIFFCYFQVVNHVLGLNIAQIFTISLRVKKKTVIGLGKDELIFFILYLLFFYTFDFSIFVIFLNFFSSKIFLYILNKLLPKLKSPPQKKSRSDPKKKKLGNIFFCPNKS